MTDTDLIERLERAYDDTAEMDEHGNTLFDARKVWQHLAAEGWDIHYDRLRTLKNGRLKVIMGGNAEPDRSE